MSCKIEPAPQPPANPPTEAPQRLFCTGDLSRMTIPNMMKTIFVMIMIIFGISQVFSVGVQNDIEKWTSKFLRTFSAYIGWLLTVSVLYSFLRWEYTCWTSFIYVFPPIEDYWGSKVPLRSFLNVTPYGCIENCLQSRAVRVITDSVEIQVTDLVPFYKSSFVGSPALGGGKSVLCALLLQYENGGHSQLSSAGQFRPKW